MVPLDAKVDFVVIGGTAMSARGSSHVTYDLDICYSRRDETLSGLSGHLRLTIPGCGCTTRQPIFLSCLTSRRSGGG